MSDTRAARLVVGPVLVTGLVFYGVHTVLVLLGILLDVASLELPLFLWPYPFMLSFQKFVNPGSTSSHMAGLLVGALIVIAAGLLAQRCLLKRSPSVAAQVVIGMLTVVVPLAVITQLAYYLGVLFGWPLGE